MNRCRCQYQKGELCISEKYESEEPITCSQIMLSLVKLALKVRDSEGEKLGGKVALKVLQIHERIMRSLWNIKNKDHLSKSFYLDKRNKNKINRSERVDIELFGDYASETSDSPIVRYIKYYRKMKHWD